MSVPTIPGLESKKRLAFSRDEYAQRLANVRQQMAAHEIDTLLVNTPENITYVAGHRTPGYYIFQCLIIPPSGDPFILLRSAEAGSAQIYGWVDDIVPIGDTDDSVELLVSQLRERGLAKGRLGVELDCWFLTSRNYLALREQLDDVALVSSDGCVEQCRVIKSPAEIEYIRKSCRSAEAAMAAGFGAIAEGNTENDSAAEMFRGLIQSGSHYLAMEPFISTGFRSGLMHSCWEGGVFQRGDTQLLEICGTIERYSGALMRASTIGQPSDKIRHLAEVCVESLNRAIEAIKPGVTCGEVDQACRGVIERAGYYEYFRKRTGYSIGLGYPPDWGEGHILSLKRDDPTPLRPGMTFHMPPALRVPGECGVGFSETVLVTDSGCEVLTNFPRELVIR
jgi:Xaa-Pro dipeptidase